MSDLEDNFQLSRGDLIYGFETPRKNAICRSNKLALLYKCGFWLTCNDFNDNTVLSFPAIYTPNVSASEEDYWRHLEERLNGSTSHYKSITSGKVAWAKVKDMMPKGLDQDLFDNGDFGYGMSPNHYSEGMAFASLLHKHNRYSPKTMGGVTDEERHRKGDSIMFAMIRKSCKFGLEFVTKILPGNANIHFILDGFPRDEAVVRKAKYDGRISITISELRWLFRNWPDIQRRVIFYRDDTAVAAPWETNPEIWRRYAVERFEKYRREAEKHGINDGVLNAKIDDIATGPLTQTTNNLKRRTFALD